VALDLSSIITKAISLAARRWRQAPLVKTPPKMWTALKCPSLNTRICKIFSAGPNDNQVVCGADSSFAQNKTKQNMKDSSGSKNANEGMSQPDNSFAQIRN
jgi:hypothetical protein